MLWGCRYEGQILDDSGSVSSSIRNKALIRISFILLPWMKVFLLFCLCFSFTKGHLCQCTALYSECSWERRLIFANFNLTFFVRNNREIKYALVPMDLWEETSHSTVNSVTLFADFIDIVLKVSSTVICSEFINIYMRNPLSGQVKVIAMHTNLVILLIFVSIWSV